MVKASPAATFIVTEADLLLEFEIVALNSPAEFRLIDHALERDGGGQRREPVVIRFGFALRPLDQQPLFWRRLAAPGVAMRRADPPSGEPRSKWNVAAVPPRNCLPGVGGKLQCQCLGRHRPMCLIAAQPLAGSPAARAGRRRQWR